MEAHGTGYAHLFREYSGRLSVLEGLVRCRSLQGCHRTPAAQTAFRQALLAPGFGVPAEGLGDPLAERNLGPPAECVGGGGRVDRAALELARTERLEPRLDIGAGRVLDCLEELQHRHLLAPADVERAGRASLDGESERSRNVPDVEVVAGGLSVTVDDWLLTAEQAV